MSERKDYAEGRKRTNEYTQERRRSNEYSDERDYTNERTEERGYAKEREYTNERVEERGHTEEHTTHLEHIDCPICKRREEAELAMLKARQSKWVQRCSMVAECLNRLRIIPRVIVTGYAYLIWYVTEWFMALPDPGTQQAALVTTVVGAAGLVFGFYMQGGITNKGDKGN